MDLNATTPEATKASLTEGTPTVMYSAVLVVILTSLLLWRKRSALDLEKLPGPKGLPLLGSILDIANNKSFRTITNWAAQYGPIYRFKLLHFNVVVITDPTVVLPLIGRSSNRLPKAYEFAYRKALEFASPYKIPSMFNEMDDDLHRNLRKTCAKAFSSEEMRKVFPKAVQKTQELCKILEDLGSGAVLDMDRYVLCMLFDFLGEAEFEHKFDTLHGGDTTLMAAIDTTNYEFSLRTANPLRELTHKLLPMLRDAKALKNALQVVYKHYYELLAEIRARPPPSDDNNSLWACLAKLKDPITGKQMDDDTVVPTLQNFIVAGFETTSHSIGWFLYDVAANPSVQNSIAEELAAEGLLGPKGRPITYDDLVKLPYFNAALKESMRLHAVAGTTSALREIQEKSADIGGYILPKGTIVWMPVYALANSPHNFPEPETYKPERWLDPKEAERMQANAFLPFSDGPRNCIGQNMAMMELRVVTMLLLSRFKFDVAPEMGSIEEVRACEFQALTVQCSKGIKLAVTPRS